MCHDRISLSFDPARARALRDGAEVKPAECSPEELAHLVGYCLAKLGEGHECNGTPTHCHKLYNAAIDLAPYIADLFVDVLDDKPVESQTVEGFADASKR